MARAALGRRLLRMSALPLVPPFWLVRLAADVLEPNAIFDRSAPSLSPSTGTVPCSAFGPPSSDGGFMMRFNGMDPPEHPAP